MLPLALLLLLVWNFFFSSSRETADTVRRHRKLILSHERPSFSQLSVQCSLFCRSPWRPCLNGKLKTKTKRTRYSVPCHVTQCSVCWAKCAKSLIVFFVPAQESEHKGFMDKLYAIQEVFISVQSALDEVASYGERIKKWVQVKKNVTLATFAGMFLKGGGGWSQIGRVQALFRAATSIFVFILGNNIPFMWWRDDASVASHV